MKNLFGEEIVEEEEYVSQYENAELFESLKKY